MIEVRNFPLPRLQTKKSSALYTLNQAVSDGKGFKKRSAKEAFDNEIREAVASLSHIRYEKLHLVCRFYFKTKHRRDGDNMIYFLKFLNDALVKANIIKDDSLDILTFEFRHGAFGTKEDDYATVEFHGQRADTKIEQSELPCSWE